MRRAIGNLCVARPVDLSMRKTLLGVPLALLLLAPTAAADDQQRVRTLTADTIVGGVQRVELRLPPGTYRIEPATDDRLRAELDVHCSLDDDRCEERAGRLALETGRQGNTLEMRVGGLSTLGSIKFNFRGRILVPQGQTLDVDLPAGELKIKGMRGDLYVDVGAGTVAIVLREGDVRSVRLGVGIGEASLAVAGRNIEGSGWLGQKVRWGQGPGAARVAVNVGVGELEVRLD